MNGFIKKQFRQVFVLVALFAVQSLYAQKNFGFLGERWNDYLQKPREDMTFLHHRYFTKTIGVEEMKEAFRKYKDAVPEKSVYEGFDSVTFPIEGHENGVMLVSPLKQHPDKKVRECRGVWYYFGNYGISNLVDKNGVSQKKLLEKLKGEENSRWIDGEVLVMEDPRWYMGFAVSPRVYWHIYKEGRRLAGFGLSSLDPDFFSYAEMTNFGWGGRGWDDDLQEGARMLGTLCGLDHLPLEGEEERTFSVLLYQKPTPKGQSYLPRPYTLELLEPENADKETLRLFEDLKDFVEVLPNKTFNPYYTTDFRIMTGRYYRVTVNKCGWLVEDYMKR